MSQTTESLCTVKVYDRKDFNGQLSLQWLSNASTRFEFKGTDQWLVSPTIKLPAEVNAVQIEGALTWKHHRSGDQKSSGSSKRPLVDFTPAIAPLRSQESWGKRMDKLVKELARLEKKHADRAESPSEWIETSGPVAAGEITSAAQRLKFELPQEHVQLFRDYGAWRCSDSFCVSVDDMQRADQQMLSIWGSPASEFASLSPKNKALYQASTMLYVEAGDGYGALIYHPSSSGGEYYWIHQDNLDEPNRLVDGQGKPRDYSSSMRWLIANQILFLYEDAFPEYIFIDRSAPTPLPYELRIDFPAPKQIEAWLNVEWSKFE